MRRFPYVGPRELAGGPEGHAVRSIGDLERALAAIGDDEALMTYVVVEPGELRLAHRRSEHVACAGGRDVLAAGEIAIEHDGRAWRATFASNLSTGYCPDPTCWLAVAAALDAIGIAREDGLTDAFDFAVCAACGERQIVREGQDTCAHCDAPLGEPAAPRA